MSIGVVAGAAARRAVRRMRPGRQDVLSARLTLLVQTLEGGLGQADSDRDALLARLEEHLAAGDDSQFWLALAVLTGELPESSDVARLRRATSLDGPLTALRENLSPSRRRHQHGTDQTQVEVVTGRVVVDVDHTAHTALATGIQRVTREVARRWMRDHDIVLAGWSPDHRRLRRLLPEEQEQALTGRSEAPTEAGPPTLLVPWQSTVLLPELAPERARTARLSALAQYSRCRTGAIGYDCIPITSAETTDVTVSELFTGYLTAVRYMDRLAAISAGSATEFRGWRHMLSAIGLEGPTIDEVLLPAEVERPTPDALRTARELLVVGTLPMVLVVGTHEPRKNHLTVLEAARQLWEQGHRFSLSFIGGHSWSDESFQERLRELRRSGRPVESVTSVSDDVLWAAYHLAHFVVFPSLNEGFGLPVAEALASGTPVVTSNFGSMQEIASSGGAVLVDPRDDASLVQGFGRLLGDGTLHARLSAEAAHRPFRTWDQYATEVWDMLVPPPADS